MTALNSVISPHFVDLYMSFLTSLLEANPKGLPKIYEFSAQYFENKLKERSGQPKKNNKLKAIFQRDVPNSPGRKQFLPDFSYDSVLILPPKLFTPFPLFEESEENLLNKERQVIRHLDDLPTQQKQGRNLLSKPQAFQENEGIGRLAKQVIDQNEPMKVFWEDQAMLLKKEEDIDEEMCNDDLPEECGGFVDNDSEEQMKQTIFLDLEELLNVENQENSMDLDGDGKDDLSISFEDFDVFDKASDTDLGQDELQSCCEIEHPNHCRVSQKERKKNEHEKDRLEEHYIPPMDLQQMKLQISAVERPKTSTDAQMPNGSGVLNQIVELSKLLPVCLEVMSNMIIGLEGKIHSPKDEKENLYFNFDRLEIPECFPPTLDESYENDTDKKKTNDKSFCSTASQTDMVGSLELMKINSSVLTPAMLEYVCEVVKAAKRLLHSAADYNHLSVDKSFEDIPVSNESEIGFNEFEKILELWKDSLDKPENISFRIDQNFIHDLIEKGHSDTERDSQENKNAGRYEPNKEPQYRQIYRTFNSREDDVKDFIHPFGLPCDYIAKKPSELVYSPVEEELSEETEKCRNEYGLSKKIRRNKSPINSSSNDSCSNMESSNHSSGEDEKNLDDIYDLKVGRGNCGIFKSQSDSIIFSHSSQNANKRNLAKAFLSKLEKLCQRNENDNPFFRSSPDIIQISSHELSAKGTERKQKYTVDLSHKQRVKKLKPEKGKTENKEKEFFTLLDPRRSSISNERQNMKNLLNYYKIHYSGYPKDKEGEYNRIRKLMDDESSSEIDEDIKEIAQHTLTCSEQRCPTHNDSSPFFKSMPGIREHFQNLPIPVEVKKMPKSTGDSSKKQEVQWYGPRKIFTKMQSPKDKLQHPVVNGFFSRLDPKQFKDVGSTAIEADFDDGDSTKIVVHEIHQATSKLQMRILKSRRVYKEAVSKTPANRDARDLDDNWRNIGVPVTGRSWLRSYFTTRMIRRYQKQRETDKIDNEIENLATPVLKHRECRYGLGSYFSQRSLFGSFRMWYFSRKLREYQRAFNS